MFEIIGKIIDWTGKNLGRIKTVGTIILVALFMLSIVKGGCQRSEIENMVERITGLNVQNDILNNDIKERDSILSAKDRRIVILRDSLSVSLSREKILKTEYGRLEREYGTLAESLIKIPADSSYEFLTTVAYPYEGDLKYPFNEPQVKGIHLTYLEKETLETMNDNLMATIKEKDFQLADLEGITQTNTEQMALLDQNQKDYAKELTNKDEIIQIQEKEIKKERNKKTFWQVTGGAIILLLAVLSASGG